MQLLNNAQEVNVEINMEPYCKLLSYFSFIHQDRQVKIIYCGNR